MRLSDVAEVSLSVEGEVPSGPMASLSSVIGNWMSSGTTIGSPTAPAVTIEGTDTYAWLLGGAYVLHTVDVYMGNERVRAVEVIGGLDDASGTFPMRSFDGEGAYSEMQASTSDNGYAFEGEEIRADLTVDPGGNKMSARWERLDGDGWVHWMDMTFTRE